MLSRGFGRSPGTGGIGRAWHDPEGELVCVGNGRNSPPAPGQKQQGGLVGRINLMSPALSSAQPMPTLLVIDDEPSILHAFGRAFRGPEYTLVTASSAAEGLAALDRGPPDVVILDVHLGDASGLETFEQVRRRDARIPVILITGHGTTELAIEAMKRGAYEYLLKPLELPQLRDLVARACQSSRLMHVPAVVADDEPVGTPNGAEAPADVLIGRCPAMQEVYKAIGRVAPQ